MIRETALISGPGPWRHCWRGCVLAASILLAGSPALAGNEYLDMDIAQLMRITITSASKKPQSLSGTPSAIFVITGEDMHRLGITSIPDALRLAPGLQVARVDANKWAVTSRGFSGTFANKLLVMIDGRSVYSPAFSGVYWDMRDTLLEDIDRIEVIRGPGATIWGANAVNGVINIITKKASATKGGLATVAGGNQEPFMGGLRYGGELGEGVAGRMYAKYNRHGSFSLHGNDQDGGDDWDALRAGFRVDGEGGGSGSWTLQGDIFWNDESQLVFPFWLPTFPYRTTLNDHFDVSGGNILARWREKISSTDSLTLQMYYDYTRRDEAIMEQVHRTFDFDLHFQGQFGTRHNLVTGLGYRFIDADLEDTFQVSGPAGDHGENLFSGFLQDEILLVADHLWLTLGAKWEHNDYTGNELQPSGRLLFKVNERHTLWAAVSRAVRTPSEFESGGSLVVAVDPTAPRHPRLYTLHGNDAFDSETLIAYEAGYRWLPDTRFSLDLALFYNEYDRLLTADPLSAQTFNTLYLQNKMHGSTHGLELAAEWRPWESMQCKLAYTYLGFDLRLDDSALFSDHAELIEQTSPRHQLSLQASHQILEGVRLNIWGRYVGRLRASKTILGRGPVHADAYLEMDVNLSWQMTDHLELMLAGQNLLNASHLEFVSEYTTPPTEVERGVYARLTHAF